MEKLNYETAKKLKDLGFEQWGDNKECSGEDCGVVEICETTNKTEEELDKMRLHGPTYFAGTDIKISDKGIIPVHPCYVPTLSELIEACGNDFGGLGVERRNNSIWKNNNQSKDHNKGYSIQTIFLCSIQK